MRMILPMMQKIAVRTQLKTQPNDLNYWLAQPISSRWEAVEQLRQQAFPFSDPANHAKHTIQRIYRVTQLHASDRD